MNECKPLFLGHWKPEYGLFIESELWPNLIRTAASHGEMASTQNPKT